MESAPSKALPFYKRRYLVNSFQFKMMYGNLLYLLLAVLLFFAAVFGPVVLTLGDGTQTEQARETAARELLVLHARVWLAIPIMIALCVLHSALMSHRVAGPLYRIQRILRNLTNGDLTMQVRVRRKDYLHEEAETVTRMISGMADKVGEIRRSYDQATRTLPELMAALGRDGNKETAVLAGKLATEMDAMGRNIAKFRVPQTEVRDETAVPTPSDEVALTR